MRKYTIQTVADENSLGPAWVEVVRNKSLRTAVLADFGPAQECICLLSFNGPPQEYSPRIRYEVGKGEAFEEYVRYYDGYSLEEASSAFVETIVKSAGTEDQPPVACRWCGEPLTKSANSTCWTDGEHEECTIQNSDSPMLGGPLTPGTGHDAED
jgi:hypothetical protein